MATYTLVIRYTGAADGTDQHVKQFDGPGTMGDYVRLQTGHGLREFCPAISDMERGAVLAFEYKGRTFYAFKGCDLRVIRTATPRNVAPVLVERATVIPPEFTEAETVYKVHAAGHTVGYIGRFEGAGWWAATSDRAWKITDAESDMWQVDTRTQGAEALQRLDAQRAAAEAARIDAEHGPAHVGTENGHRIERSAIGDFWLCYQDGTRIAPYKTEEDARTAARAIVHRVTFWNNDVIAGGWRVESVIEAPTAKQVYKLAGGLQRREFYQIAVYSRRYACGHVVIYYVARPGMVCPVPPAGMTGQELRERRGNMRNLSKTIAGRLIANAVRKWKEDHQGRPDYTAEEVEQYASYAANDPGGEIEMLRPYGITLDVCENFYNFHAVTYPIPPRRPVVPRCMACGVLVEPGDRITFKCLVAFRPFKSRVLVRSVRDGQSVLVHSNGAAGFVVYAHEITKVEKGA